MEKANRSQNQQSSSSSNNNQNKHQKKLFIPRDSGSSSQNSDKKTSDLNDKIGKDGKLTIAERACHFTNNLCLFYVCSVEEEDIQLRSAHELPPPPQKLREEPQNLNPKPSPTAHQLRTQKNRKQPFDLCLDFRLH